MSIEYFMIVTKQMWEQSPELSTDIFTKMLSRHYPDVAFDITAKYENNLFGPSNTVALLAKEIEK